MLKRTIVMLGLIVCFTQVTFAKSSSGRVTVQQYISKWGPVAKSHMFLFRIPASIILAQGILESGYGNSQMAQMANNHFGIKCLGWDGEEYYQTNSERGCYRKYEQTADSYRDHARIISNKARYAFLFRLNIKDYKSWAWGLKKAGYAEDKQYAALLIKTIEDYQLYKFDIMPGSASALSGRSPKLIVPAESTGVIKTIFPLLKKQVRKIADRLSPVKTSGVPTGTDDNEHAMTFNEIDVKSQIETAVSFGENQELVLPRTSVNYVIGSKYDTFCELAAANNLTLEQILEYNDIEKDRMIYENEIVYIQPKNNFAADHVYTMRNNQTLWEVSQLYGVRVEKLEKLNNIRHGEELPAGAVVQLR